MGPAGAEVARLLWVVAVGPRNAGGVHTSCRNPIAGDGIGADGARVCARAGNRATVRAARVGCRAGGLEDRRRNAEDRRHLSGRYRLDRPGALGSPGGLLGRVGGLGPLCEGGERSEGAETEREDKQLESFHAWILSRPGGAGQPYFTVESLYVLKSRKIHAAGVSTATASTPRTPPGPPSAPPGPAPGPGRCRGRRRRGRGRMRS